MVADETYKFEFCLPARAHAQRLNAFFAGRLIIEAEECLVRLHALRITAFLSDGERELQLVCLPERQSF